MIKQQLSRPVRPLLFAGLAVSIPAFYLQLTALAPGLRLLGGLLYAVTALLTAVDIAVRGKPRAGAPLWRTCRFDIVIFVGALASIWHSTGEWSLLEWGLRLAMCGLVFLRLAQLMVAWLGPHQLFQLLGASLALLAFAGAGFLWLEPNVHTYADGLWLAFTTGATVGYGDIVPSTPAARIFAVFIVLLGYAVFSVVTATISALFISADEKRFEQELHHDIRALRREIDALRDDLHNAVARAAGTTMLAGVQPAGTKEKGRPPEGAAPVPD